MGRIFLLDRVTGMTLPLNVLAVWDLSFALFLSCHSEPPDKARRPEMPRVLASNPPFICLMGKRIN